jgi:hypothetical protein
MRGGTRSPLSSPWVITTAPIIRVVMPQEVVWQSFRSPSSSVNSIPMARAKFWPRSCEVPHWSALPSCIIASIERLALGTREALVLRLLAGDHRDRELVLAKSR